MRLRQLRHSIFLLPLVALFNLLTCSQNLKEEKEKKRSSPTASLANPSSELAQAVEALAQDPVLKNGFLAFSLKQAERGQEVYAYQADKTLNVASCMKAITTATALAELGADFQFKTRLEYDGKLEKGTLQGNLYIRGGGDPSLGSDRILKQNLNQVLTRWVQKIKQAGIQKITGKLLADESAFFGDITPQGWVWGDMGNYFGAPASAINVLDNSYELYFQPGRKIGDPTRIIRTQPEIPEIQFVNEVKTAAVGSGDQASISGAPYDPVRYVSGTIPLGGVFKIKGSLPDPALWLAQHFRQLLINQGISVQGEASTVQKQALAGSSISNQRTPIYQHLSPPLSTLIRFTNLYSINLYAEAILKAIGQKGEREASTLAGAKAVQAYWQDQGLDVAGFYMQDGSGLSRANGITADQLSEIFYLCRQKPFFQEFYNSLPIAGISGTMYSVAAGTRAQNNLRAKTGYMTRVLAYVGYFKNTKGELMCFSLIANEYNCSYTEIKKKLGDLMVKMVTAV